MRILNSLALAIVMIAGLSTLGLGQSGDATPVEFVPNRATAPPTMLGTNSYKPSAMEKPFLDAVTKEEKHDFALLKKYDIAKRDGVDIAWFGIVRVISENKGAGTTELVIEHKYFDGLTDLHLQIVSFNGSGDFKATLRGLDLGIRELALVRVYGKASAKNDVVSIPKVVFVRHWDWGSFSFMGGFGVQRGSRKWRKHLSAKVKKIYSSNPDENYYVERLGPRPEKKIAAIEIKLEMLPANALDEDSVPQFGYRVGEEEVMDSLGFLAFFRNQGVRRQDRRRPGDSNRSLTRIRLLAEPELLATRVLGLATFGGRQDVGIESLEVAMPNGESIERWSSETLPRGLDLDHCPRLFIKGPRARRGQMLLEKKEKRSYLVYSGADDRKGREVKVGELEDLFADWGRDELEYLIIGFEGDVSLGEVFDLIRRARCKHPRILRLPASRYLRPLLAFK
ncbi:MAG: hypothetical protein V3W41_18640 [Planctomycetota bacterium]